MQNGVRMSELTPGTRIGEYVVERSLADESYLATHRVLRRRVTIAIARPGGVPVDAMHAETLDHPGIPRVFECGLLADRRPWTATELIEGHTIAELVQRSSLSALDAAGLVRDVAEVLDHAHNRGVVHGNVRAESIVVADGKRRFPLCLVDWTCASALDPDGIAGAADVFALGVIARQLLHRACPGTAPPVFAALVQRMLADGPAQRPTAFEVRDHAAWLADQIEPEVAVPQAVDDDHGETRAPFTRPITSEIAPNISGEITESRSRPGRDRST